MLRLPTFIVLAQTTVQEMVMEVVNHVNKFFGDYCVSVLQLCKAFNLLCDFAKNIVACSLIGSRSAGVRFCIRKSRSGLRRIYGTTNAFSQVLWSQS